MLSAEGVAQIADVVIGLFTVVVFFVVYVISGAENDVVMDVSFVNVSGDNIGLFTL